MFSSGTGNWSTPIDLFKDLDNKYKFTVDVCADTSNYKVKRYYNEKQDGLSKDWSNEIVWCNPPYSNCSDWVRKAAESKNCLVVMLVPARVDTRWFHDYIYKKDNISYEFIKGRLKFSGSKTSAPFPSMIVIFNNYE
jgi:phage N-6-adenine-methyltransferase